jgi:hypothetical protein
VVDSGRGLAVGGLGLEVAAQEPLGVAPDDGRDGLLAHGQGIEDRGREGRIGPEDEGQAEAGAIHVHRELVAGAGELRGGVGVEVMARRVGVAVRGVAVGVDVRAVDAGVVGERGSVLGGAGL